MRTFTIIIMLFLLLISSVVVITADDNGIILVPAEPMANKNLVFYIPSINMSANGYLICENNDVHLVEIHNHLGQVTLDEDDYGTATVKIFVGNKTYTKTFEIKPFLSGTLTIEAESSVLINTEATIKIAVGAKPAEGAAVSFLSLSGRTLNRVSDENGIVTISFDEDGPWEIQAEIFGVTASATITVMLPPLEIVFSDNIEANEEMTISVGSTGSVTITKDELTWSYQTDANGDLYFTPPWAGKYNVYVKTDKQEGSKTFITISETKINVYDYEKSVPISSIKKGQIIEIVVVDSSGVPVSEIDEVLVTCDGALWDSMPLSEGSVVWLVDKEATTYHFEVEGVEGYEASDATIYGKVEETIPFGDIIFYVILIIIIIAVVMVFIRLMKAGRIPVPKVFGKKLSNITSRSKKLE